MRIEDGGIAIGLIYAGTPLYFLIIYSYRKVYTQTKTLVIIFLHKARMVHRLHKSLQLTWLSLVRDSS